MKKVASPLYCKHLAAIASVLVRATVTNDPVQRPIVLRTQMAAGHGGRSGRYAAWEQTAWEWAFVLDQLSAGE